MTRVVGDIKGEKGSEWTLFVRGDVRTLRDYPALAKRKAETKSHYSIATFRLEGKKGELEELYFDAYLLERSRSSNVAPRQSSRKKRRK